MDLYTEYTVISLFSGIGGLDLGVRDVLPARTICYVEREIKAARILAERASEGLLDEAPIYSDVKTFPTELFAGKVDIDFLLSGFPCQPFSVAGKQSGASDDRNLFPDTIRIIRELRPRYVFLENVPGLVAHEYFGTILGELAESGYDAEWGCFKASDIGASHRRERLFILANATGTGLQGQEHWLSGDASKPSGELAHAKHQRSAQSEPQEQSRQRQGLSQRSRNELAHAGHAERQGRISDEGRGIWVTRDEPAPQGSDLAHAKHDGHTASERTSRLRRGQSYTGWPKEQRGIEQSARSGAESSLQPELAHATGIRDQVKSIDPRESPEQPLGDCWELDRPELPEFPPGPGDPSWEWIVEHYPELAPATCKHGTPVRSGMYETESPVRNVDDAWKISDRVAALMMLGNAVVPAQAAYALRELISRDSVE